MEPILLLIELEKIGINESVIDDISKYMDDTMIEYMNANLNDPARRTAFLRAMKRYGELADRTNDPMQKLYFEYRAYLPAQQAKNLARDFYRQNIRNGVYSDTIASLSGEEGATTSLADSISYGNNYADKGMFANLTGKTVHPGRTLELDDLFIKLFDSPLLDKQDRIVLVIHLLLGTGPNLRAKSGDSDSRGIDLRAVMNKVPDELGVVEDQIRKLIRFGVTSDEITRDKILFGVKKDGGGTAPQVTPLMSSKRKDIAITNIKNAATKLFKIEDINQIKKFLLSESISEASGKDSDRAIKAIGDYLGGDSVEMDDLIVAIVYAVGLNIQFKTRLSKSKLFGASQQVVANKYIELAKTGKEADIMKVQDLFLAPVIDKQVVHR